MKKAIVMCAAVLLFGVCPARAQNSPAQSTPDEMRTPEQVVTHHLAVFTAHDVEGILSDYADDAIFLAPKRTVQGKAALRAMFESFAASGGGKGTPPAPVFEAKVTADGDVGYEHWVSNPGKPGSMEGTDAFVVRHGKILFHTVLDVHPAAAAQ